MNLGCPCFVKCGDVFQPGRNADQCSAGRNHIVFLVCLSFCLFVKVFEPGRNADHAQRAEVHSQSYGCRSHSSSEIESVIKSYMAVKSNQIIWLSFTQLIWDQSVIGQISHLLLALPSVKF